MREWFPASPTSYQMLCQDPDRRVTYNKLYSYYHAECWDCGVASIGVFPPNEDQAFDEEKLLRHAARLIRHDESCALLRAAEQAYFGS